MFSKVTFLNSLSLVITIFFTFNNLACFNNNFVFSYTLLIDEKSKKLPRNLDIGKEVYLVELLVKDPSELGFENFTKLIQNVSPLTQYKLMEKKLSII